jgi:hypothetical protein
MNLTVEVKGYLSEQGKKRRKLVFKRRDDPAVENFMKWLFYALINNGQGSVGMYDITGTSRTVTWYNTTRCQVNGPAGNLNYGIIAGTGTNPVTMTDYALQTVIAHGTGAGQLDYAAVTFGSPTTSGKTRYFEFSRALTNSSGDTITVNEIGVYIYPTSQSYYYMFLRDVLPSGVQVGNGQVLTIKYRVSVTA